MHTVKQVFNKIQKKLEGHSVERIPCPPTLTFDLPKINHFVPCGQGYD